MSFQKLLFYFTLIFFFSQCAGPSTKMVDTWSGADMEVSKLHKVLIVAIAKTKEGKASFENKLKEKIEKKNVTVVAATDVLPPDEKISEETFYKYFENQNFDAVIVSRLASVQDLPGTSKPGKLPDFYEFYDQKYDDISVDFTDKNLIFGVETRVYETKELEMIWSGLSKTFEPGKPKKLIKDLTTAIFDALEKEGFF
jgi:hypothetical protein